MVFACVGSGEVFRVVEEEDLGGCFAGGIAALDCRRFIAIAIAIPIVMEVGE